MLPGLGDTRKKTLQVYLDRVLKIIEFNVTAEEEFIQVAQSLEASRKKWQQVEKDLREKQESLLKCEIDRSALQVKLKHARNQVDVEMKKRQRAETELEKAERQMQLIAELLKSDGQAAVPLSDSVLAFFGGGRVNAAAQGSANSRLSMVDESCTSFLSHSDISYDQTEDDLDLEGFAGKPVKLKTRERRRSSLAPLIAPLLKRPRPSAAAAIVAENIKEAIISKTTMLVTDSGPMAISTMEAVPRRRSRRSRAISSLQDQALGLPQINEAEHELEPEYVPAPPSNPARTHSFLSKTMIRAELCSVCGQKTRFGKMSLKCRDCRILIHPECRDLCPKVCSSSSLPSSGIYPKNGQGILADFAPVESPRIPGIVIQCVNEIERRGLKERGIYRVPGCDRVVKEMKQRLVQGKVKSQQLAKEDIHAVCGALKEFLRNLQEPLLSFTLHSHFMDAADILDENDAKAEVCQAVNELPPANRDTLAFLILHLHRLLVTLGRRFAPLIGRNNSRSMQGVEPTFPPWLQLANQLQKDLFLGEDNTRVMRSSECKMDKTNLSRVFGPTLVGHSVPNPSPLMIMQDTPRQAKVMSLLLSLPCGFWNQFLSNDQENQNCDTLSLAQERLFHPLTSPEINSVTNAPLKTTPYLMPGHISLDLKSDLLTGQIDTTHNLSLFGIRKTLPP